MGSLGLAIASFAIVAVPGLLNGAMQDEVQQARLFDVAMATRDLDLSPAQLAALGRLPNVAAFEPAGSWEHGRIALVLLAWIAGGLVLCITTFRWQSRN